MASLVGHQKLVDELLRDAERGTLHHGHLFLGPEHVGKTKTALTAAVELQGASENVIAKKQLLEGLDPDTLLLRDDGEGLSI